MARARTEEEIADDSLIFSAPSVDDCLESAARRLGRPAEEIEFQILDEGSGGIFGLGARPARIKVLAPDVVRQRESMEVGRQVLLELLEKLGVSGQVSTYESMMDASMGSTLQISSPDARLIIGRQGQALRDLEYLTRLISSRRLQRWPLIHLDVDGYRARRWRHLRTLATEAAEKVRYSAQPVPLPPMPPWERRIVHQALQSDPDVTTKSVGSDPQRQVVVWPSGRSGRPTRSQVD